MRANASDNNHAFSYVIEISIKSSLLKDAVIGFPRYFKFSVNFDLYDESYGDSVLYLATYLFFLLLEVFGAKLENNLLVIF